MKPLVFAILVVAMSFAGFWSLRWQNAALAEVRTVLQRQQKESRKSSPGFVSSQSLSPTNTSKSPSTELLRLRSEVTLLRQELESPVPLALLKKQWANDWELIRSDPHPSGQPGFVHFTNLSNADFTTPQTAFESINFLLRAGRRMTPTEMKQIWNVPDDYDDPGAKYSIDIGEGIGPEIGYRIFSEERIGTNRVRLMIDYEKPDGMFYRREKVLIERDGRWRLQPVSVTRQP